MNEWRHNNKTGQQTFKNSFPSLSFGSCVYHRSLSGIVFFPGFHPSNFYQSLVHISKVPQIQYDANETHACYPVYLSDWNNHYTLVSQTSNLGSTLIYLSPSVPISKYCRSPFKVTSSKDLNSIHFPLSQYPSTPFCQFFKLKDWSLFILHAGGRGVFKIQMWSYHTSAYNSSVAFQWAGIIINLHWFFSLENPD